MISENGFVIRGPYGNGKGGRHKVIRLVNPKNRRELYQYPVGEAGIAREKLDQLIALAKPNERFAGRRGRPQKAKALAQSPTEEKPGSCAVCKTTEGPLGLCKSLDAPHCKTCCDKHNHKVF